MLTSELCQLLPHIYSHLHLLLLNITCSR